MKQNRKILYIVTEYKEGMRPYALSILKRVMNTESHAVIVIREERYKKDFTDFPQDKIHFVNYPEGKLNRILFRVHPGALLKKINELIASVKPDLLYTMTEELVLAYRIKRIMKSVNVLHTVHDAIQHDIKYESLRKYLNYKLFINIPNRIMFTKCQNLVTNSLSQFNYLRERFPEKEVFYFNFPTLVTPQIENGKDAVPELKGVENYILFFGNVQLYKGVHLLYDMYSKHPELQQYPLVVAGKGDSYFPVDSNLKNVYFINRFIEDSELNDLFAKAAVTVYPYISATQSGVLSLSSFYGKKMLLSDVPYFKSIATDVTGVKISDVKNRNVFAADLKALIESDTNTFAFYKNTYSPSGMDESIENAISAVCAKR